MKIDRQVLSAADKDYWQARLHSLRYDCGCKSGTAALLISLIFSLYYFLYVSDAAYSGGQKTLYIFLLAFGGSAVGKIIGIGFSRVKYHLLKKRMMELDM